MSDFTLADWKNTATISVMGKLPSQTYDSAFILVEAYLSNVGGWVPDGSDPVGPGHPADNSSPDEAATNIHTEELAKVYDTNLVITVQLRTQFVRKLTAGLDEPDVIAAIQSDVETWLTNRIANSPLPLEVVQVDNVTGTVDGNGELTAATRVALNTTVVAGGKFDDYKAVALAFARNRYTLDTYWNVSDIHYETNSPIILQIGRYTALDYLTLDPNTSLGYVIAVAPDTYVVTGGGITTAQT